MQFYFINDNLCLDLGNGCVIRDITAYLEYAGTHYDTIILNNGKWKIENGTESLIATDGVFTIEVVKGKSNPTIRGTFVCEKDIEGLVKFCFLKGKTPLNFYKAYINGATPLNGVKNCDMSASVNLECLIKNKNVESTDFTVGISENCAITIGAVNFSENYSTVEINQNGTIALSVPCFWTTKNAGEKITSNYYVVAKAKDLSSGLELYADEVHLNNGGNVTPSKAYSGWCSWYYYGPNISEKIIIDNMNELKKRSIDVDIIQIDDGWNKNRGDWEANEKFPSGMKALADQIKSQGYIPGIWVSPLTADEDSDFIKNNKDCFVLDENGEIYGYRSLDLSNEKAQKYLYDLFYKLSHTWGYRYIKFDFIIYGFSVGNHKDKNFNGVKNYKKALEIMRSAITEDTILLACTSPLPQPINYVQCIRTSMDIFEQWNSLKQVAKQVLLRLYLNKHVRIDPDCVMLRKAENEDDEAFRLCTRTDKEIQTFISFIAATGGTTMLSDKVMLLSEKQTDNFKLMLPINQFTPKIIDFGKEDIPSKLLIDGGDIKTLLLFNWEDFNERTEYLLESKYHAYDFWEKTYLGKINKISFDIPAHGVKVIHLSNCEVVSTKDRIVPNLNFEKTKKEIIVKGLKDKEKLIYVGKLKSLQGGEFVDGVITSNQSTVKIEK